MKRFLSLFTAVLIFASSAVFADNTQNSAKEAYSSRDIIEAVGKTIELYGVYGKFDSEELYLDTVAGLLKNHPELYDEALKIMLESTDKYGAYFTKEEAEQFNASLEDTITGIGIVVSSLEGRLIVSSVVSGSPAGKAGFRVGDILLSADGVDISTMDIDKAVSLIRGKVGTSVKVTALRDGVGVLEFTVFREIIQSKPVEYEISDGIGYIKMTAFTENSAKYFAEVLDNLDKENVKDIIIDLRDNGGGYFDAAIKIADLLLPPGKIITTEDHRIDLLDKTYTADSAYRKYNTVILINEHSASSSEVLTAALVQNGAAVAIGKNSYGKGTVQTMASLPNGGMIKYTCAFYLTPDGSNIEGKGIAPSIEVENAVQNVDMSQFTELKYSNVYSVGMTNPEIGYAKQMLAFLGLYYGEMNDYFDENLRIAVYAFQNSCENLGAYGVLDKTTQLELFKVMNEVKEEKDNQLEEAREYLKSKAYIRK